MFERFQFIKTQAAVFYTSDGFIRNSGIYSVCNETECLECKENGRDSVATSSSSGDIWIGGECHCFKKTFLGGFAKTKTSWELMQSSPDKF